jgi:preprotein translocase subunit SecY
VLSALLNGFKIPELRKRLAFTAAMIAIYRAGSWLPTPGVDSASVQQLFHNSSGTLLGYLNLFSGQALANLSLFALGIMPYITASIIMQLLGAVIPSLEQLRKEGESGQRTLTQYTRYLTVALAAGQAGLYTYAFRHGSMFGGSNALTNLSIRRVILIIVTLTAGSVLLMWIGENITRRGIGNGASVLIFCSILTSIPTGVNAWLNGDALQRLLLPLMVLGVVLAVVYVNEAERRIPIQYAKRMIGGRTTGGESTYMPLRVNMAGVIPVIFAAAVLILPPTLGQLIGGLHPLARWFAPTSWASIVLEFVLIVAFTFFYTTVTFNPHEQADNLKKFGGFIPGIRPGRPTAEFLDRVSVRLTLPGGLFLGCIAVLPTILIKELHFSQATARALGGTSVLIVVGVALDTMRQMQSQVMMRHYEGFLK